jgi:hypothetical protein
MGEIRGLKMTKATITANLVPQAEIPDNKEIEKQIKDNTEYCKVLRRIGNA